MNRKGPRLSIVPVDFANAKRFVAKHHRHHPPPIGHKFSVGVADEQGTIRGVAMVGRPVARMSDDGWTLEVNRVATDGCRNACSALYGAAARAAKALGYRRLLTYTLPSEGGASLRASGWAKLGRRGGGSWSRDSRARDDKAPLAVKSGWEKRLGETPSSPPQKVEAEASSQAGLPLLFAACASDRPAS